MYEYTYARNMYNKMIELLGLVTRILHVEALRGTAPLSLFLDFPGAI